MIKILSYQTPIITYNYNQALIKTIKAEPQNKIFLQLYIVKTFTNSTQESKIDD